MILITSAAFVTDELSAEFGHIPPSFLPIGNRRLFIYQIKKLKEDFPSEVIFISLPQSFTLRNEDLKELNDLDAKIIYVPDGLSLGNSIIHVLINFISRFPGDKNLSILHGDTLIEDLPAAKNVISVSQQKDFYNWEIEENADYHDSVWCGYFSFGDNTLLLQSLQESGGHFVNGIKNYEQKVSIARIECTGWSDFGHVNTYYKSRTKVTTQRSFNDLIIADGIVTKTSSNNKKIIAESSWYLALPPKLKIYTPQLIAVQQLPFPSYSMEYLYHPTLNELFVFGAQPVLFWDNVIERCLEFLVKCEVPSLDKSALDAINTLSKSLVVDKTLKRLSLIEKAGNFPFDNAITINSTTFPSLKNMVEELIPLAWTGKINSGYLHGDFCFSNIFFDMRANRIKAIDPRGLTFFEEISQFGDLTYDYAKLSHSVLGGYDFIIANMFHLKAKAPNEYEFSLDFDNRIVQIQESYKRSVNARISNFKEVYCQMILLFISMVPLHNDSPDRQLAFLLNSYRLYKDYKKL